MRLLALLLPLLLPQGGKAQTYIPAGIPDGTFQSVSAAPTWMNNAEFKNNAGTLLGVVWDDNSGTLQFTLRWNTYVNNQNISAPTPITNFRHPDIILGGNANNNYMAIVYTASNSSVDNVYCNFYKITLNSGGITVTPLCSSVSTMKVSTNTTTGAGQIGDAHIDMLNTGGAAITGNLMCVVWEAKVCGAVGYGTAAAINSFGNIVNNCPAPNPFVPCPAQPNGCINPITEDGQQPDVALVTRLPGSTNMADMTYVDGTTGILRARRWNINNGTLSTLFSADPGPGISYPRIDEMDDPNMAGLAYPEIVYQKTNTLTGTEDVWQTNTLFNGPSDQVNAYLPAATGVDNLRPVVACGPNTPGGFLPVEQYSISYASTGTPDILYNNVMWNNGHLSVVYNYPDYDFFEVNFPQLTNYVSNPLALTNSWSVFSPAKIYPDDVFECWYDYDPLVGKTIRYKTTVNPPAFKPTEIPALSNMQQEVPAVYPNPVSNVLYIQAGIAGADSYSISDITGRTVMQGDITGAYTMLQTGQLAKGMYIAHICLKNKTTALVKFIKD